MEINSLNKTIVTNIWCLILEEASIFLKTIFQIVSSAVTGTLRNCTKKVAEQGMRETGPTSNLTRLPPQNIMTRKL